MGAYVKTDWPIDRRRKTWLKTQIVKEISEFIRGGQGNYRYNDGAWLNATKWLLELICPSKFIAFDATVYELSKQLHNLHIDATLLSETRLKPHEKLYIVAFSAKWGIPITCYKAKHIGKR
jgi:hypothetical protein